MEIFYLIIIVSTALLLGNEFSVAFFVHPSLQRANHQEFLPAIQVFARLFGKIMPFWMGATVLTHFVLAYFEWTLQSTATKYILAAAILWVVIVIFSILAPVPINNRVGNWHVSNLPNNWESERRLWDIYNIIRVFLILTAFVLLLIGFKE